VSEDEVMAELLARYGPVPGQSVSIERSQPSYPPPEWRWGGPKPDGYRWPAGTLTPGLTLNCESCGAAVNPDSHEQHTEWHRWLWDHLGMRDDTPRSG
jgi:hypothetical protein